ncbi:hypothetical protein ACFL51_00970 [Myxococcota bacterium]
MVPLLLVVTLLGGCRRIVIASDFESPYELEDILLPQSTRSYVLAGPPGTKVDIGLDFEESERRADHMQLTVVIDEHQRQGAPVAGSQIRRAVCGVKLTRAGVRVDVENLNTIRSAPFSLRIERWPSRSERSRICHPRRVVPSSVLVRVEPQRSPDRL